MHLIIPDVHVKPKQNLRRIEYLGSLIDDIKPTHVMCLGDWADMESLSSYDKGKKSHEGRRYAKDIEAANRALGLLSQSRGLKAAKKYYFEGNHEDRIRRASNLDASLDGLIGLHDLDFIRLGWRVFEFLKPAVVDGVHYQHYWCSGLMGKPIGGEYPANAIIAKQHVSAVAGHSHLWAYAERTKPDGKRIQSVVAGCYLEHEESYARGSQHMWWSGITVLHDVKDGMFDFERISLKRLKERYG